MKKLLIALSLLFCTAVSALAQTSITLPIAANSVADLGNGPIKVRMVAGNASIFTAQGSGTGGTSGSSTALTLTATPATPPIVGALISGSGITSGTTVAAYNGTTGVTLSAAMTVAGGTTVSWGAACSSTIPSAYIQASPQAGFYIMYTQARVCAVSPGGPVNTLLIEPIYNENSGGGGSSTVTAGATPTSGITSGDLIGSSSNLATDSGVAYANVVVKGGALGTPSSGTLTNTTGLPVSTGLSGLGTGVATALGDNVGSAGAPVVNGGALGTPSSGVLTSVTGLPISTGVSGLGTGAATALGDNVGSAGAFIVNGGALGTPSSGVLTNATGLPLSTGVTGQTALAQLPTIGANTSLSNWSGSSATPSANTYPSCADSGGNHLNYVNGTGVTCGSSSSGGAMVLLNTLTASNSATLSDTSSFTATYSSYLIIFQNIVPATADTSLEMQVHSGGSFQATSYLDRGYEISTSTAILAPTTFIGLTNADTVAAAPGFNGKLLVSNPSQTVAPKTLTSEGGYLGTGTISILFNGAGYWNGGNGAVDGFQVLFSSGNITSGVIKIYGIQ